MPDSDRPRRPVPAWVTAPHDGSVPRGADREAPPTPAASAPVVAPEPTAPAAVPAEPVRSAPSDRQPGRPVLDPDAVVPDFPPSEDLLPPAPTSPTLHTAPVGSTPVGSAPAPTVAAEPAPVSPIDAAREPALAGGSHQGPVVPRTGQPRFSVPGLEHVVVEGTEPAPSGPVGFRTPARFAHQQTTTAPAPEHSFESLLAAPPTVAESPVSAPVATEPAGAEPVLPSASPTRERRTVGATPSAALGAVAGIATLGLAVSWFTAPSTVHVLGLLLGVVAVVCSVAALRSRAATWQRPVALLGAVLGGVGTLVLLWAVATALGAPLPDLTGTGTAPTLAP
ncbi:hypothetical protein DEJ13_06650 [Curtobacterium sp. MCLR17_007]|uniref:hypothetical protein n=1 Tax=Curtobacterium sp. MCLR17_007 TaxID=2175648 RepID=UPI0024DFC09C|nr:hypothetical protein [Curtobacterium sp. MCLR17_007]WIB61506.1 hypothetical protein DEJ13_06650 [Curtobacterium sp. MCLR17_007]